MLESGDDRGSTATGATNMAKAGSLKSAQREGKHEGFEVRLEGFRLHLGRAAVAALAAGLAAILCAIAARW